MAKVYKNQKKTCFFVNFCHFWATKVQKKALSDARTPPKSVVQGGPTIWFVSKMTTKITYVERLACCYARLIKKNSKIECPNFTYLDHPNSGWHITKRNFSANATDEINSSWYLQKETLMMFLKHIWFSMFYRWHFDIFWLYCRILA